MSDNPIVSRPEPSAVFVRDEIEVLIFSDRAKMGRAAAFETSAKLRDALGREKQVSMMFAAAPSQEEFLANLKLAQHVDWQRVRAFHMDEYVRLPAAAPQSFRRFLQERLFDVLPFGEVHYLDGEASDPQRECQRYSELLEAHPPTIICGGIGENGHLAFNDPPVAYFDDPALVKVVELEAICRQQQVNDGCFAHLEDVPTEAITVTLSIFARAAHIILSVPGRSKAKAVNATLNGDIGPGCPATILRRHPNTVMCIDRDAAMLLDPTLLSPI